MKHLNNYTIVFIFLVIPAALLFNVNDKNAIKMGIILLIFGFIFAYLLANKEKKREYINLLKSLF